MNESITRALSGIVYIFLLLAATYFHPLSFMLFFGAFLIIAVTEFCNLVKLAKTGAIIMAVIGYILFGYFNYLSNDFYTNILLNVACLVISISLLNELFSRKTFTPKDNTAKQARLIGYVIIPFLLLIKLPFLTNAYRPSIVIGMFILIWANDTFAYIVGKAIGKRKLFERISPKKTIEGFAGGMLFTVLGAYFLGQSVYFTVLTPWQWMAFAAILVVFGTLGDLVESKLKRNAGVKDSGKIMPGHGGILDRLDSILFAIPFIFLYYQILYYVS